jgi:hypothetical protein
LEVEDGCKRFERMRFEEAQRAPGGCVERVTQSADAEQVAPI